MTTIIICAISLVNIVYLLLFERRVIIIRESTKQMRDSILNNALQIFIEYGYENTSMRKIASRTGITAGAIYKHFSGKEEIFQIIFENCAKELLTLTDSMISFDFTKLSNEELINIFYSRISLKTFDILEKNFALYHVLLVNDSGHYISHLKKVYIKKCVDFLKNYYDELYRREITTKTLSLQTITLLSLTEFSSICELIMDDSMAEGISTDSKKAFIEEMNIISHGLEIELGLKTFGGN